MFSNYQLASNYYIKYINTGCRSCALRARQKTNRRRHMLGLQTRRQGDVSVDVSMCSLCCLVILYISALAAILASCVICRHQVGSVCR